jgi:hypothetical protein
MSKTVIIPIVGFLAVVFNLIFHVNIDEATQGDIVNLVSQAVALVLVLDGIFRNHKKE